MATYKVQFTTQVYGKESDGSPSPDVIGYVEPVNGILKVAGVILALYALRVEAPDGTWKKAYNVKIERIS